VVDTADFAAPHAHDTREFSFALPPGPYSFSGTLVSVVWALELVLEPGPEVERLDFVLGPSGAEVLVGGAGTPYEGA
jgi:hypothetical protein